MKRLSWKYIAGFVDGEGCIDVQIIKLKNYPDKVYVRPRIRICLAESGKEVLELLENNFGGKIAKRPRKFENPNWQDAYNWQCEGKRMRNILQNIVNHLILKKEQTKFCIWIIDNLMGKHTTEQVRESVRNELKAMKRDSQRLSEEAVRKIKLTDAIVQNI